jgi:hypothetical protein
MKYAVEIASDGMIYIYTKFHEDWFGHSCNNIFLIGIVGVGVQLVPLGTAATNRSIVPVPVIMMMEKVVE